VLLISYRGDRESSLVGFVRLDPVSFVDGRAPGIVAADAHLQVVEVDGDEIPLRKLGIVRGFCEIL
jgi:hypothetical protein